MNYGVRTWIELDKKALFRNAKFFLNLISRKSKLMAVVKSNAYGHGLIAVARELERHTEFKRRGAFGVDSIVEGIRLRKEGVTLPILVLGMTLSSRLEDAVNNDITITVSSFDGLKNIFTSKRSPKFHLKIDTGMHRQGFLARDIEKLISILKTKRIIPDGIYTHFAAAKDPMYPTAMNEQLRNFRNIEKKFSRAGFDSLVSHASATGGTLIARRAHLDMVRVGMGLYGYWPSDELKVSAGGKDLAPVLQWKTIVGEIKKIPAGSFIGYDYTERVSRPTTLAVLPIGYWHGFDRGLSGIGEVIIGGKRRRVLGRVSMDMVMVDVTEKPGVKTGDEATLIGSQGRESIWADEVGLKIGTSQYEMLTRLNPLMKRAWKNI